jgi:hypothetical protein
MGFTGWPAVAQETVIYADVERPCGWNQLVEAVNERILAANATYGLAISPLALVVKDEKIFVEYMRTLRSVVETLLSYYYDPDTATVWQVSLGKAGFLSRFIGQSEWTDPVLVGKREETLPSNPATKIKAVHVNEVRESVRNLLWLRPVASCMDLSGTLYRRSGYGFGASWSTAWANAKSSWNSAPRTGSLRNACAGPHFLLQSYSLSGSLSYGIEWSDMGEYTTAIPLPNYVPDIIAARMPVEVDKRWTKTQSEFSVTVRLNGVDYIYPAGQPAEVPLYDETDFWFRSGTVILDVAPPAKGVSPGYSPAIIPYPPNLDSFRPANATYYSTGRTEFGFHLYGLLVKLGFAYT